MASTVFGLVLSVALCATIFLKRKMIDWQIQMSLLMIVYELVGITGVGLIVFLGGSQVMFFVGLILVYL